MKATDLFKILGLALLTMFIVAGWNVVEAQEYDDLYFNSNDRQTVKIDKSMLKSQQYEVVSSSDYKEISSTTENFSAKNVNPEYIARYKSAGQEEATQSDSYTGEDYFVEDYESRKEGYVNTEDYLASKKYDRDYTRQTAPANTFNPMWNFNTHMGFGAPWGMRPGFGFGYGPSYGWNLSMSWGTGMYNPYNSWYSPFGMYDPFYDPWYGPGFYDGFHRPFGYAYNPYRYGAYNPWGGWYGRPIYVVQSGNYADYGMYRTPSGTSMEYRPRTSTRSNSARYVRPQNSENDGIRRVESRTSLRTVSREQSSDASGRIATDYARTQNEYYNRTRSARVQAARSDVQQSASQVSNRLSNRAGTTKRDYSSSSMINNRPVRSSSGSTYQRSSRSYSSDVDRSRSSSSFSSPSRSSSYGSSNSGRSYSGSSTGRSSSGSSRSSSFSGGRR